MGHFWTPKTTNPRLSLGNQGLRFQNVAVKERFETTRKVTFIMQVPALRGAAAMLALQKIGILSPTVVPWILHQVSARGL